MSDKTLLWRQGLSLRKRKESAFYRFLTGTFIVRTTDWMDLTILNWFVFQWTGSPVALGILNACRLLPTLLISFPTGILADRYDRKKLLIVSNLGVFCFTLLLALIVFLQWSIIWLFVLVVGRSLFMTLEVTVRNAFLSNVVSKEFLPKAISLQTMLINVSRMIGPAIAGWLLVFTDVWLLFLFVAFGSLIAIAFLGKLEITSESPVVRKNGGAKHWRETIGYIKQNPLLLSILLFAIAPMIFGFPYTTMLPLFVDELMKLGPSGLGILLSVSSLGAIIATAILTVTTVRRGRTLVLSSLGFGGFLIVWMLISSNYVLSLVAMGAIGFFSQLYRTTSRIALQLQTSDEWRGRVLSIALMDRAYIPLGAIIIGFVASIFGAAAAGWMMGVGCVASVMLILWKRKEIWSM